MSLSIHEAARRVRENVGRVLVGKEETVDLLFAALLAGGHVLIEDVPGVGKTTLARALARSLGCTFKRIQFTPDLLPSDVTGITVYNQAEGTFTFRPGPVFAHLVLADEINRATPRTQSALLEAMQEGTVTVDGVTHELPRPFLVLATQNPVELEGTFPLPEAQLDRFLMRIRIGYPDAEEEARILSRFGSDDPLERLEPVVTAEEVLELQAARGTVRVEAPVREYIVALARASREHPDVVLGASPRASLALYRVAQALAAVAGRDYVLPDDVKEAAVPVLAHRLILTPEARMRGTSAEEVVAHLLTTVPVPVEGPSEEGQEAEGVPGRLA